MADKTQVGKVALITGANKGIGKEIARQLGAMGATVLIGARDQARGDEAVNELKEAGIDARTQVLDVTNAESIQAAAIAIEQQYGRIDILVNNAGVALDNASPSQVSLDIVRKTYETNVFGVLAVTQALLPLLRKSDAGRIVNHSSGLGSLTHNSNPNWEFAGVKIAAYNSSKAVLNMLTVVLADELKNTPIKVNAADPGYTATDMNQNQGPRSVAQGATAAVRLATLPADGPTGGFFDENGAEPW